MSQQIQDHSSLKLQMSTQGWGKVLASGCSWPHAAIVDSATSDHSHDELLLGISSYDNAMEFLGAEEVLHVSRLSSWFNRVSVLTCQLAYMLPITNLLPDNGLHADVHL